MAASKKRASGAMAGVEDEADIVDQLGATPIDPEDPMGPLLADEEKIREAGAVDTETIRRNRINQDAVNRKRAGDKGVTLNEPDLIAKYEQILKIWPANALMISVRRITGTQAQLVLPSSPKNGRELYDAIKQFHGRREEASYEVGFHDSSRRESRGSGKIHMPDTRDESLQAAQGPMPYYSQQPPYPQPPPQPQYGQPYPQQPPPQAMPMPLAPAPAPAGMDMNAMMAFMQQQFEMWNSAQQRAQQVSQPQAPQSAPSFDFAALAAFMQQQQQQQQPQAPQPAPAMLGMPPVQPPPGMMFVPGFGFVPVQKLLEAMGAPQQQAPPPPPRDYYPPPRSPYGYPQPPPQPPRSPADQFRETIGLMRSVREAAETMQSLWPNQQQPQGQHVAEEDDDDDDNPVRVMDIAGTKLLLNKEDGSARLWETGLANMDKIAKWVGEQSESIRRAQAERQRPAPQQLPPGYVVATPGYQPPPGYVAIPEQPPPPQQAPLPPPPAVIPPPIGQPEPQQTWDIPSIGPQ